eukprot:gene9055-18754_t
MNLLRSSAFDGSNVISSVLIVEHEGSKLAIWGCENTVKIWNFTVRQDAMDAFKRRVSMFVQVNQYHIMSSDQTCISPDMQLEGTEVLHDDVVKLTNVLMDKSHYRTMIYDYPILKILHCEGLIRTYIICNMVDYENIFDPNSSPNTDTSTSTTGPLVCIHDLHTEEHIRTCRGIAVFAGELGASGSRLHSKTLLVADFDLSLVFYDLETGIPLRKVYSNFDGIHKAIVCPGDEEDGDVSEFAVLSEGNIQLLVSAHDSSVVRVWDLERLLLLREFPFDNLGIHTIALRGGFHPLLITGSYFGAVEVHSLVTGELLHVAQRSNQDILPDGSVEEHDPVFALATSTADIEDDVEAVVVSVDVSGKLNVWDLTGVLKNLRCNNAFYDGTRESRTWDKETAKKIGHRDPEEAVMQSAVSVTRKSRAQKQSTPAIYFPTFSRVPTSYIKQQNLNLIHLSGPSNYKHLSKQPNPSSSTTLPEEGADSERKT